MTIIIELTHVQVPGPQGLQPGVQCGIRFDRLREGEPPNLGLALVGLEHAKGIVMQQIMQQSQPRVLIAGMG